MLVAICTPCRDVVQAGYCYDLAQLLSHRPGTRYVQGRGIYIPNLRNDLARTVTAQGAGAVLFIDSDMRFPPDALTRLLKRDRDVCGANYRSRTQPELMTAQKGGRHLESAGRTVLEEADVVATGMLLVKAHVFAALPYPWFSTPWDARQGKHLGEDVYFSKLAREAGYRLWVDHDLSREVRHTGETELSA